MSTTRVTGMYSGIDTESLIQQLVEAKSVKVKTETKNQLRIKYKQDAWGDLNKKIKNLFTKVDNLRYEGSYSKRTTEVSDSSVASVVTSDSAMISTQSLKVKQLAKAGYLTGGQIESDEKATNATKLTDLGIEAGSKFSIKVGDKETEIEVTEKMTLSALASKLNNAGVSANFDSANQRFYIGASKTGLEGDFSFSASDEGGNNALSVLGLTRGEKKIDGQDAMIELNGVEYSSNENNFTINGLTITAKAETGDKEVTLNTTKDTSAIYDKIKDFVKTYSELINEMDSLYNADMKTKYDPLTDEEKSAMSDYEIEKWEEGLKKQILSKDETLRSVSEKLKMGMQSGFKVGDKTMYLFDFGIETGNYFSTADNEKYALHIRGDEDDSMFATDTNKLKELIASDTDSVVKFFSQLGKDLYESMNSMSSRVPNSRTYGYFFDDQKLASDYKDYTSKIADMEEKLSQYEDKWYKKFSAMETALAKMQSSQNAVAGFFG